MPKPTAPTTPASTAVSTAEGITLKTKHLAAKFGLKPTALRRKLRDMPEYADGVFTRYSWQGWSDPMIAKIEAKIEADKKAAQEAAAKAKAELEAKAKAEANAKAADASTKPATK